MLVLNNQEKIVTVRCPVCDQRIFDTAIETTGLIAIKCPRCKNFIDIKLSKNTNTRKYKIISNTA